VRLCIYLTICLNTCLISVSNVILTDYDPGSLRLLAENIQLNESLKTDGCMLSVKPLTWGSIDGSLQEMLHMVSESPRLIIGSDLIYCKDVISPLLETVKHLLDDSGVFLLACSFDIGEESNATLYERGLLLQLQITEIFPHSSEVNKPIGRHRLLSITSSSVVAKR